jgi:hypothetical protein
MSLDLNAIDLKALPAILLLGWPRSGKTQSLMSWSMPFRIYKVERDDNDQLAMDAIVEPARSGFRSPDLTEYVLEIGGSLFRVFDLPGEVLTQGRVIAPDQNTTAGRLLLKLLRREPRVAGVIAFAVPPSDRDRAAVGFIHDVTVLKAYEADELGVQQTLTQLQCIVDMVEGFVWEQLRDPAISAMALAVQIGFADLVHWDPRDKARLERSYGGSRPGSSSKLGWLARRTRASLLHDVDAVARATFSWLDEVKYQASRLECWHVPVSNAEPARQKLPSGHSGAGLLCVADRIVGSRARRAAIRSTLTIAGVVLGLTIGTLGALHEILARRAPELLPVPLDLRACQDSGLSAERCACPGVLARANAGGSLGERLGLLSHFMAACRPQSLASDFPQRTELLGLAAQFDLANAAIAPSEFDAARFEATIKAGGRPGTFAGPTPWYPAESVGQVRVMQAIASLAGEGRIPDATRLAGSLNPKEQEEFAVLLRLLTKTTASAACLNEWKSARELGFWKPAVARCGSEGERLPEELRSCYRADASVGFAQITGQPSNAFCANDSGCDVGVGLEALLYRVPKPDHDTFANLAAGATTSAELSRCLGRALGASHAHLLLLRLLGPGSFQDRLSIARSIGDDEGPSLNDFFRKPWVVAESGRRVSLVKGKAIPQRAPMLPLKDAVEAACALVDVSALYNPPATLISWREPLQTEQLDAESLATFKARAALSLLASAGGTRTVQSAGCEVVAVVTLLRLPGVQESSAWFARLNSSLRTIEKVQGLPEASATAAAATKLRCRLGLAFARLAAGIPDFAASFGCPTEFTGVPQIPATAATATKE